MICSQCRTAADTGGQHCGRDGQWCTCQHQPVGYLIDGVKIHVNVI